MRKFNKNVNGESESAAAKKKDEATAKGNDKDDQTITTGGKNVSPKKMINRKYSDTKKSNTKVLNNDTEADSDNCPLTDIMPSTASRKRRSGVATNTDTAISSSAPLTEMQKKDKGKETSQPQSSKSLKTTRIKKTGITQNKSSKESESDDEIEQYEVEDIMDHKVENGTTYFLIRWKGYTKDDDSWEAESSVACPALIEKYNKKNKAKQPITSKPAAKQAKGTSKAPASEKEKTQTPKKEAEKEWEVDKIVDFSDEDGGRMFRIRWKGYSADSDTWEPESNLHCKAMVEKFLKSVKAQENVSFKQLREEPKKTKRLLSETANRNFFSSPPARKSKRSGAKKSVYYGDSD